MLICGIIQRGFCRGAAGVCYDPLLLWFFQNEHDKTQEHQRGTENANKKIKEKMMKQIQTEENNS